MGRMLRRLAFRGSIGCDFKIDSLMLFCWSFSRNGLKFDILYQNMISKPGHLQKEEKTNMGKTMTVMLRAVSCVTCSIDDFGESDD